MSHYGAIIKFTKLDLEVVTHPWYDISSNVLKMTWNKHNLKEMGGVGGYFLNHTIIFITRDLK